MAPPPPRSVRFLRLRVVVEGVVQGVGFRPHVYRLARSLGLAGWVRNDGEGVRVEVEGTSASVEAFVRRLVSEAPPAAEVLSFERFDRALEGGAAFSILASESGVAAAAGVQADMAPCGACLRELWDEADRRFRYPFLSCTQCGPRFTILEGLPYDRARTTMRSFPLCAVCAHEYSEPGDRRFHAQPLACADCGPQLSLWAPSGEVLAARDDALVEAKAALRGGAVLALKGRGGFQLVCRADDADAVSRVRAIKSRPEKPLAVMVESLVAAAALCALEEGERALLTGPAAPIVLVRRREAAAVAGAVAPGLATLGVMLPATPLHHLLARGAPAAHVVTSCNRPGEPLLTCEREVLDAFGAEVDGLLVHDRRIANFADDSVVRLAAGRGLLLRRARGFAPRPVPLGQSYRPTQPVLAAGGQLKATVALSDGSRAWVSQHVGDLGSPRTLAAYGDVEAALLSRRGASPAVRACDLHPDCGAARRAAAQGGALLPVQHHVAHVLAVLAEHDASLPTLGIAWDGTGYGADGAAWGGEAFEVSLQGCRRLARLRPFRLPGGDRAAREPRRSALGVCWGLEPGAPLAGLGLAATRAAFTDEERRVLVRALERGVNAPETSSVGRLFDAVASLLGLCQRATYEAQAASLVEQAVDPSERGAYRFALDRGHAVWELDWRPALQELLGDVDAGVSPGVVSARFHAGLADAIVTQALAAGLGRVALSGGCFLNRVLLEAVVERCSERGLEVDWPRSLPPGDGALSVGQLAAVGLLEDRDVPGRSG